MTLGWLGAATGRSHGLKYHHNHHHSHLHNSYHNRNHHPQSTLDNSPDQQQDNQERIYPSKHVKSTHAWRPSDEDYEDEEDGGRHSYLMTKDTKKTSSEKVTEDQTLTQAFEKHMQPGAANIHDVYAYQLPSDLWFVVRYSKNTDGQVEKYMNVVSSFTNYLEKLDKDVRTVSVNVKGVETVFRLTPKQRKPDN